MKYLKMLALTAVAAGALMAFIGAGTASATVLCSTATSTNCGSKWPVGTEIDFTGSKLLLTETTGGKIEECTGGTVEGKITNAGSATETVKGSLSVGAKGLLNETGLKWSGCEFPTTTLGTSGGLEIHASTKDDGNGTLTATSTFEVTINTIFFGSCIYGVTTGASLGELTEGKPAVFHANAVAEKFSGSNIACPSTALWTGTYTQSKPENTTLYVATS